MKHTRLTAALTLLPLALAGVAAGEGDCRPHDPDGVADNGDEVELCEVRTYFHQAETKAGNLGGIAPDAHSLPSWDTEAPSASVTAGGGGGTLSANTVTIATEGNEARAAFEGTFTGAVDVMDVDLHLIDARALSSNTWTFTLELDGWEIARVDQAELVPVPQEGADVAYRLDFAFTNLLEALRDEQADIDGEHTFRITAEPWFIPREYPVFVYDTTEVPGGILFNAEALAPDTFEIAY